MTMPIREAVFFGIHRLLGTGTWEAWKELLAAEEMSREELLLMRDAKLAATWEHLRSGAPFFRERLPAGPIIDKSGRLRPDVWARAPVVSKDDIRNNLADMTVFPSDEAGNAFVKGGVLPGGWGLEKSGGSTGRPIECLQDPGWRGWNRAAALWCDKMSGAWPCREKRLKIWGGAHEIGGARLPLTTRLSAWMQNSSVLPCFRMDEHTMRSHLRTIDRTTDVTTLEGYSSALFTLARFAESEGIEVQPLQRIISSAGNLYPYMKDVIERVFDAPVFNRYGSRDGGATANQCEMRQGLHICEPTIYLEVVDEEGMPVPNGSPGEILITQIENRGMPLFRYRIGDCGIMDPDPCPCGMPHRTLKELVGRVTECVRTPDGRVLDSVYFAHLFGVVLNTGWIDQFQVVQEEPDIVTVLVTSRSGATPEDVEEGVKEIGAELGTSLGPVVRLSVNVVDDIPPSPSGKQLHVVSRIGDAK